ncbi:hypothetical protein QLQ12_28895 [Actinoplanes sp. NEAU-A12]|uniref:HTH cro/C1-type domain-containing protein n=1 Tax=Actinoplanes sandaracinus TaxID=3045177 RepID=A0ABT6WSG8_9ACTN|nr:hypothetical protein [Actinoplanes sandaracinus]MDI6102644.1 hypothetical protein [Actinoplanes sandaracinus]
MVDVDAARGEEPLPPLGTLSARLNYLFDTIRPTPDEVSGSDEPNRRYTNKEIADKINAVSAESSVTISAAYIGELRRGIATDPRTSHVRALARAFDVDPAFFVDDKAARRIQEQIETLIELRRMDVKQVALRHLLADTGLSVTSALLVEQMIEQLRTVEEGRASDRPQVDPPSGAAG